MPEEDWSLNQSGIFDKLENEHDFFQDCITATAIDLAAEFRCDVEVSSARLTEVWDFWLADMSRTSHLGFGKSRDDSEEQLPVALDHFKRAAFLAFWLRRITPIIEVNVAKGYSMPSEQLKQKRFFAFGNELMAYNVALQLCGIYEYQKVLASGVPTLVTEPGKFLTGRMRSWSIVRDYVMVLRHKSVSPHSLYLIFRSLFLN